jgi:hypothetical protein
MAGVNRKSDDGKKLTIFVGVTEAHQTEQKWKGISQFNTLEPTGYYTYHLIY